MNKSKMKNILIYSVVILLLGAISVGLYTNKKPAVKIKYSDVVSMFQDNKVQEFKLNLGSGVLDLKVTDKKEPIKYTVPNVAIFIKDTRGFIKDFNKNHTNKIDYDYIPATNSWWMDILPYVFLIVIMMAFWFFIMKKSTDGGKIGSFGKAKIKPATNDGNKVTFADVAGADEEKEELQEIVGFLKNPRKFNEIGARIPKGVLLIGPPGTGKTLLAKAVSGEAGVPFYSISGSDFVEMFVGVGASRVRDLFETAKKTAPSIIFIDEIDAVGRHRGAGLGGGHDEREQTLNQLLVEMDGFGTNQGVIVMAATNRRDILDPALMRPGRFDRQVYVGFPDIKGREEILKVHSKNKPLAPDVNLNIIARTTSGFTGADLENLLNEAALLAARSDRKAITMKEIEEASIKVIVGPEKRSRVVTEKDKRLTAYHEAGHAIATYNCPAQDPVHQISIVPRGMAGGFTMSRPVEDRTHMTKGEMQEEIIVLLAGRVAEKMVLDDISTGASSDIQRATKIAKAMVTRYGFSEKLGPIVYGSDHDEVFLGKDFAQNRDYSENVAAEIDSEIREIIDVAYEKGKEILETNMEVLHKLSAYLIEFEKIDGDLFAKYMKEGFPEIQIKAISDTKEEIKEQIITPDGTFEM